MDFPTAEVFNRYFALGAFAFYIVGVSLWRVMAEKEFFRLTAMKKIWGRRQGLFYHFLSNVALPLVAGIVLFSQGVVSDGVAVEPQQERFHPPWSTFPALLMSREADLSFTQFGVSEEDCRRKEELCREPLSP